MKKLSCQTKKFLEGEDLYPKELRDQTPLEKLISIHHDFEIKKEKEYQRVLERYDSTGIYEEDFLNILQESLAYLHAGIKFRYERYKLNAGKNFCGPIPK